MRDANPGDLAAVQAIYAHHVLAGLASFEEVPPDLEELRKRYDKVRSSGLPYIVAMVNGAVAGYGYCGLYHTRSGYRYTLEDSIYVDKDQVGRGVGKAILATLIERCTALGYRQMLAIIGNRANEGSIGLHASLGFVHAGMLRSVGFKFGRWIDSILMQRPLGPGDGTKP